MLGYTCITVGNIHTNLIFYCYDDAEQQLLTKAVGHAFTCYIISLQSHEKMCVCERGRQRRIEPDCTLRIGSIYGRMRRGALETR